MTTDLKKYCVEHTASLDDAKKMFEWLSDQPVITLTETTILKPKERKWVPQRLTKTQKAFLSIVINMRDVGAKINGATLGKAAKCSGPNALTHLNNLRKLGYLRRDGNKYTALRGLDGQELPPIVTKYPAQPARGYKPMTAPLGKIARVKC